MQIDRDYPLATVCTQWLTLLEKAKGQKRIRFQQYADEIYRFYNGSPNWMWKGLSANNDGYLEDTNGLPMPQFQIQMNKVSDAVDLFGPAMIHQYPQVNIQPVTQPVIAPEALGIAPQDPRGMQQFGMLQEQQAARKKTNETAASVMQHYANWVQVEGKKKEEARKGITEAIIKGGGVGLTELHTPRGSNISYPRSRQISIDQLIIDPDASSWEDVQWIAIEWTQPVNRVEEKFGLAPGVLKGSLQSKASQSTSQGAYDAKTNKSKDAHSYDLITYYEVYSKNGFGHNLKDSKGIPSEVKNFIASWGDFTYAAYAKNIRFPLNLPSEVVFQADEQQLFDRAQWPIPFWHDDGSGQDWPISMLRFKDDPNDVWPISIFKPVIGMIRFVNWCMSFLADKASKDAVDYLGVMKAAAEEIQDQLVSKKGPTRVIEISSEFGGKIQDLVSFLNKPQSNVMDLWNVVSQVMEDIDKSTGLTDLVYGMTGRQMRSAREADLLGENSSIRPNDMAEKCDDWYALMALKELQASAWLLERDDYEPALGPLGASVFETQIQTADFDAIARDYTFRLAAGSARKPNKAQKLRSLNEFGQVFIPTATELVGMGITQPLNAFLTEYAKAMDLDASQFLIELPAPQPEPEQQGPTEEEIKAEAKRQELEQKQEEHRAKLVMSQQAHGQALVQKQQAHNMNLQLMNDKNRNALNVS